MTRRLSNGHGSVTPESRAGADGDAKDDSALAWRLLEGFYQSHQRARGTGAIPNSDEQLTALLELFVPEFCDWCSIDIVPTSQFLYRHNGCLDDEGASHSARCLSDELFTSDALRLASAQVLGGAPVQWGAISQGSTFISAALRSGGHVIAAVTLANHSDSPPLGTTSAAALEYATWMLGEMIDHDHLQRTNRESVRQTQGIARQLHQLIAASITVARAPSEEQILTRLATSARSVFDGDVVTVTTNITPVGPLTGVIRRGQIATIDSDLAGLSSMGVERVSGHLEPWTDGDWLVAPILIEPRKPSGSIAVSRAGRPFSPEDREVITLLGQMAAAALSAMSLGRAIAASEERQRVLLETAPIGIVEVGPQGQVKYWNRAASRILGWRPSEEDGAGSDAVFPSLTMPTLTDLWQIAIEGEVAEPRDVLGVEIAGRSKILSLSAAPLPSVDGSVTGILTLVDDVTSQRELKAEIRHAHTMEMRGQIASRIAHDFNNLLTLISGYSEILTRELESDQRLSQMAKDIQATASRASLLTGQLQTIGRTKVAAPIVMNPIEVMQSNAEVLERILGSKINVTWIIGEAVNYVRADADQFEQMILNLSINARDAMPDGGELTFSVERRDLDGDEAGEHGLGAGAFVQISVTDSGIGMDDDTMAKCFQPLFTTKGPFTGTGMGLAAARRLAEESGGAIWCRSTQGVGTTFEIVFPAVDAPGVQTMVPAEIPRASSTARVLVVEDDDALRRLVCQVLRRNGYDVYESTSAENALEQVTQIDGSLDLLITDVEMGQMTGRELAGSIQRQYPFTRVLLVSGTADASIVAGLSPKISTFLAKPFRPSALIDSVHELLGRST